KRQQVDLQYFPTRRSSDLERTREKKKAVESMLARLQSNPKYQELVGKYGEEVLLKAMKAFTNDIKEGKINKPDYPINYFLTVGEDRKSTRLNSSHVKISYA